MTALPIVGRAKRAWQQLGAARVAIPVAIFLIGVFFRFYRLDTVPPGLNSDESTNLMHMLGLLHGQFKIIFGADAREPFLFYLSTVPLALFGPQFFSMRLIAALVGVTTIPLIYGFTRYLFRSVSLAALASFFAAISVWHIFWSRYGLRAGMATLFVLLALWWFWRALVASLAPTASVNLAPANPRRVWRDYTLAGICTGLSLYTYLSARMLPVALVLATVCAIVLNRRRLWTLLQGLVLTGSVALVIFVPLAVYFWTNWQDLVSHSANLSIFDPRVNKGDLVSALWDHIVAVARMFLVRGDHEAYRNIPNRPVFDPLLGAFFVLGLLVLAVTLVRRRSSPVERLRAAFVGIWVIVFSLPSVLSDDPPSAVRTLAAMPAVMMLPAWAIVTVGGWLQQRGWGRILPVALTLLLVAEAGASYRDYFLDYAPSGVAFYAFDGHIVATGNWVNENAAASQVFLAPLWAQQPTMQFITRQTPTKSFESRDTVVLPSRSTGRDAFYVFPQEQEKKADNFGGRLGALGVRQVLPGAFGVDYAIAYRVPAANLPDPADPLGVLSRGGDSVRAQRTDRARFADQLETVGSTLSPEGPGGRNLTVTLFLRALEPLDQDYTFSLKVRDGRERVWGQEDKWAGDNSYATSAWGAGELVIEKFYPGLSACAPAGDYHVTVEAYNPATLQVLGSPISLGTFEAGPSEGNRREDLEPEQEAGASIPPQLNLLGWTLTPQEVHPGDAFSLWLFWRGVGQGAATQDAEIRLGGAPVAQQQVVLPPQGRGLCTSFDLQAPADAAPGQIPIVVNNTQITTLDVVR